MCMIRAQRKANLCAHGAPKGPKVEMSVRQYEILCANDAGALLGNTLGDMWQQCDCLVRNMSPRIEISV